MACSEARLAANRANARKSTGPNTDEGKDASRRNALKHGLTGSGLVVPGEDADKVARESAAFLAELAPDGLPTARLLAERVATLAVRLRRSARHEFAATAERTRIAALDFDEFRQAEADRLFGAIDEGSNRADLLAMPEGVDLLDATLAELKTIAASGDPAGWSGADSARLVRCLPDAARTRAGLDRATPESMPGDPARGPRALDQIIELIDAERARLRSIRSKLDHATIARARVEAINLVLVDAEPATLLARKYEAATERALFRALREIREARRSTPSAATPPPAFPSPLDLVHAAEASRRELARLEPAPTPPLGSIFPGAIDPPAAGQGSTITAANPTPHGRSRFEDRRQRPKLGR